MCIVSQPMSALNKGGGPPAGGGGFSSCMFMRLMPFVRQPLFCRAPGGGNFGHKKKNHCDFFAPRWFSLPRKGFACDAIQLSETFESLCFDLCTSPGSPTRLPHRLHPSSREPSSSRALHIRSLPVLRFLLPPTRSPIHSALLRCHPQIDV